MARDVNRVMVTGHLTEDPKLSKTKNEKDVCNFSIAINGKAEENVTFLKITTWEGQANACSDWLSKGDFVQVDGYLQEKKWIKEDGSKRSQIEVTAEFVKFLHLKKSKETKGDI